jgi:hypothetical protein
MPWKGERYVWTTDEKMADLLSGIYEEYDEKKADLDELVAAVRRDQAVRLRTLVDGLGTGPMQRPIKAFGENLLNELDPDTPDTV